MYILNLTNGQLRQKAQNLHVSKKCLISQQPLSQLAGQAGSHVGEAVTYGLLAVALPDVLTRVGVRLGHPHELPHLLRVSRTAMGAV